MKQNFIFLDEAIPGVRWDAKYATWDNFVGRPVNGYKVNRVVGTVEMADALKKVNEMAQKMGVGLLLWDGYRPVRAVSHYDAQNITKEEQKNRKLLRDLMEKGGFVPYENEWWHYS